MSITVRIDDDLLSQLRRLAEAEAISLTELVNRVLRQGLITEPVQRTAYREQTFSMGPPLVNIDNGLALADALSEEEVIRKLAGRN